jgi:hypothetical protein
MSHPDAPNALAPTPHRIIDTVRSRSDCTSRPILLLSIAIAFVRTVAHCIDRVIISSIATLIIIISMIVTRAPNADFFSASSICGLVDGIV